MSYRSTNLQTLHFKYLFNKYTLLNIFNMLHNILFFLENAVYSIMLPCLVSVLFTF